MLHWSEAVDSRREPALGQRRLVSIASKNGRERIELIDLRNVNRSPTPELNQSRCPTGERECER